MPRPAQTPQTSFIQNLEAHSSQIALSLSALIADSAISDKDHVDYQNLELKVVAHTLVAGVQDMLKLTNELRLSALTSDLEARNHHADNMDSINRRAETRDRDRVKRIRTDLGEAIQRIELHLAHSRG